MSQRALFVISRSAATGRTDAEVAKLLLAFRLRFAFARCEEAVVDSHDAARAAAYRFGRSCEGDGVVVAGGGAGTLRAVVEGLCREEGRPPERIQVAPLRLGSGNVLAKTLGVATDARTALQEAAERVRDGAFARSVVLRCEADGEARFSTTLVGLGQLGRIPGDLARWHRRIPRVRRLVAGAMGIERLTRVEYGMGFAARALSCAMKPERMERVEVQLGGVREEMPLLAGAVIHVSIPGMPFRPSRRPGIPAFTAWLVPGSAATLSGLLSPERMAGEALRLDAEGADTLTVRLTSGGRSGFFLDEDPMEFREELRVRVAGMLRIVPGRAREPESRRRWTESSAAFRTQPMRDEGYTDERKIRCSRNELPEGAARVPDDRHDSGESGGSDIHQETKDGISLQESEALHGTPHLFPRH